MDAEQEDLPQAQARPFVHVAYCGACTLPTEYWCILVSELINVVIFGSEINSKMAAKCKRWHEDNQLQI